jgi:glycosyltransferase A (GT-A) superfamily protein (DUF2064 family)
MAGSRLSQNAVTNLDLQLPCVFGPVSDGGWLRRGLSRWDVDPRTVDRMGQLDISVAAGCDTVQGRPDQPTP